MALLECKFFSDVLHLSMQMTVILPQSPYQATGNGEFPKNYKTLYLLHGYSDDHTIWLRRTSIERYATAYGIAVVMPSVHLSFYTDMAYGGKYWTFVSEELPVIARSFFPLSGRPEDNYVAGLSMGGYGAFKLGLRCPDRFAGAASLSGAMDIVNRVHRQPRDYELVFGGTDREVPAEDDLFKLAQRAVDHNIPLPRLYQICGTEDVLHEENVKFKDFARNLGITLKYEDGPGAHDWQYWDDRIQDVLAWFFQDD